MATPGWNVNGSHGEGAAKHTHWRRPGARPAGRSSDRRYDRPRLRGRSHMADKIRLGFVGANVHSLWASQSHFPALQASSEVELTAVCTTRPESAAEARVAFGAELAFTDWREMVRSPAID